MLGAPVARALEHDGVLGDGQRPQVREAELQRRAHRALDGQRERARRELRRAVVVADEVRRDAALAQRAERRRAPASGGVVGEDVGWFGRHVEHVH